MGDLEIRDCPTPNSGTRKYCVTTIFDTKQVNKEKKIHVNSQQILKLLL